MSFAGLSRAQRELHDSTHSTTYLQPQSLHQQHSHDDDDDDDDDDDGQRRKPLIQLQPLTTTMAMTTVDSRQLQQTSKYDLEQQKSVRVSLIM